MAVAPLSELGELAEGVQLPERRLTPTSAQVSRFIDATGAAIPIFYDPAAARATGLRGPIIAAEMKSGFLHSYLRRLVQPHGQVVRLQSAFRRPDYHGDPITIGGQITRIDMTEHGREIHLELWITQQTGDRSVRSSAILHLP